MFDSHNKKNTNRKKLPPLRPNSKGIDYDKLAAEEGLKDVEFIRGVSQTNESEGSVDDFGSEAFDRDEGYFFNCGRGDE